MPSRPANRLPWTRKTNRPYPRKSSSLDPFSRGIELLEDRQLLSTITVTNLKSSGPGSLRQAIVQSNAQPGEDTIAFDVTGTIRAGRSALPAITDRVTIDGASAPSFAGSPVVTVNFQGTRGFVFRNGADGSTLRSLSLVKASNAGVTLMASRVTVEGNYIGLQANGKTQAGNRGDGIRIVAASHDNLIGHEDPVSSITYYDASKTSVPVKYWQGIRNGDAPNSYLIAGTSGPSGLWFEGGIDGQGVSHLLNYPGATTTSAYGPDNLPGDRVRMVGSYNVGDTVNGFLFEGTVADINNPDAYRTINYPGSQFNFVHSTMAGLAVGNYDGPTSSGTLVGPGRAYIYDIATSTFVTDITFPGSSSNTAYGIWHNEGTRFTICGGFSPLGVNNLQNQDLPIGAAYLVDYDAATGEFSHWKSYDYPNGPIGREFVTHFEGISSVEKGVYTLNADSVQVGTGNPAQGSWVSVRRNADGTFGDARWVDLNYPDVTGVASSNSVYGDQVVGVVFSPSGQFAFQATVNTSFQLSNVISGNRGNGIAIQGSSDNHVGMNFIGTDATGTLRRGNGKNGIHMTRRASGNLIGGQATGGNNPTGNMFVRPPQGNLISGNRENGVLIDRGATKNVLSGNFVGTATSGNSALGNRLDGVAIDRASGNDLIGCTFRQDPFVFYNVISGNGGNGVRVNDSNDVTIHANFMGVGANNASIVANRKNGLLVSGTSKNTQVGGVIPLGNVIAGNRGNGIEVTDRVSGFVSFNTFAGLYAFSTAAPNQKDGIHITSRGGNNLIRTCIVSGNRGDGIEIGGNASGVQVTETSIGTNTNITTALPNGGSGIKISGNAHNNAIGGFQPSIEPRVTISSNGRYGIEIVGKARKNSIFNTNIGTGLSQFDKLGNTLGGVVMGPGTSSNTIGGESSSYQTSIFYNGGAGLTLRSSSRNTVIGNLIFGNNAGGVVIRGGSNNQIGTPTAGNTIEGNAGPSLMVSSLVKGTRVEGNAIQCGTANGVSLVKARKLNLGGLSATSGNKITENLGFGLQAVGNCAGTVVRENVITDNTQGNVNLTKATGIRYVPR